MYLHVLPWYDQAEKDFFRYSHYRSMNNSVTYLNLAISK